MCNHNYIFSLDEIFKNCFEKISVFFSLFPWVYQQKGCAHFSLFEMQICVTCILLKRTEFEPPRVRGWGTAASEGVGVNMCAYVGEWQTASMFYNADVVLSAGLADSSMMPAHFGPSRLPAEKISPREKSVRAFTISTPSLSTPIPLFAWLSTIHYRLHFLDNLTTRKSSAEKRVKRWHVNVDEKLASESFLELSCIGANKRCLCNCKTTAPFILQARFATAAGFW